MLGANNVVPNAYVLCRKQLSVATGLFSTTRKHLGGCIELWILKCFGIVLKSHVIQLMISKNDFKSCVIEYDISLKSLQIICNPLLFN